MKAALTLLAVALLAGLVVLGSRWGKPNEAGRTDPPLSSPPAPSTETSEPDRGFLYGRVTTLGGAVYQGRLRWGGDEEAFWSDYFNGLKKENRWATQAWPEGAAD